MVKKKIFFLINSLEWWGAERVITNLSENLSDYDVSIVTLKNINFFELPNWVKHIHLSNIKNNLLMFLALPYFVFKFKKLLKQFDGWVSFLEISNFVNILSNPNPIISFRTSIDFFGGFIWFFYKLFIKFLYPKASKIIVNCEENKYDLAKYLKINPTNIEVIYNPINPEKIEELKVDPLEKCICAKSENDKVFITVSRLIKSKNHHKIIRAFKYIYDNIDQDFSYIIVGNGPEWDNLADLVAKLWLSQNIYFVWAQKNVFKYLNCSNYFVFASEVEWFPNVLIEAMYLWLRIITANFKTWAQEIVFGSYDSNQKVEKITYWPNWVLVDLDEFENNFVEIYKELSKLKQSKLGFSKFLVNDVLDAWKKVF